MVIVLTMEQLYKQKVLKQTLGSIYTDYQNFILIEIFRCGVRTGGPLNPSLPWYQVEYRTPWDCKEFEATIKGTKYRSYSDSKNGMRKACEWQYKAPMCSEAYLDGKHRLWETIK